MWYYYIQIALSFRIKTFFVAIRFIIIELHIITQVKLEIVVAPQIFSARNVLV